MSGGVLLCSHSPSLGRPELSLHGGTEMVANRLKVLSDATMVGLLRQLTESLASVTDLARRFRLAQPTATNHVRMLREAGLLEARKDGAPVVYAAPRERLAKLMGDTMHILLEH